MAENGSMNPLEMCISSDPDILFDDTMIKNLDLSETSCHKVHGISYHHPGTKEGRQLIARPLERTDFNKGYLNLLSQLTKVGDYSQELFENQFDTMKKMPGSHLIIVVEDPGQDGEGHVVASASLLVECKFIHNAAMRGRIEDVVVDSNHRGKHLGSLLLEVLNLFSKALGCYKVTLDCKEKMLGYYKKLGYVNEGQFFLSQRFSD